MPCPNKEFCKSDLRDDYYAHFTHCINCRIANFGTLQIHDAVEACIVCGGLERQLKFPNSECTHSFCLACSRNIILWNETRYHLNPCNYGCPPCPNGCENPDKGTQCYCVEYDAIKDAWEIEHPDNYKRYDSDERDAIDAGEPLGSAFASRTCPLCRRRC